MVQVVKENTIDVPLVKNLIGINIKLKNLGINFFHFVEKTAFHQLHLLELAADLSGKAFEWDKKLVMCGYDNL